MKTRHYYQFDKKIQTRFQGDTLDKKNWDILRMDEREGAFSIEQSIERYEENCMRSDTYKEAANIIYNLLLSKKLLYRKIISLGVGKGILEWHLKKMDPQLIIECTDYTESAIERLKPIFGEDIVYQFDMLEGDYSQLDKNAILIMYRVSTEFDLRTWRKIFGQIYAAGISYIVYIPTGLDGLKEMLKEKITHVKNIIKNRKDIQCGWLYSENEYPKMFKESNGKILYFIKSRIYFNNTAVFFLEMNDENTNEIVYH